MKFFYLVLLLILPSCKDVKMLTLYRIEFLLGPAVLLALFLNHEFSVMELLWTFSIYLESVAILPQLFMVSKTGEAESITSHYLFALGSYRALYIVNWVYRYYSESKCIINRQGFRTRVAFFGRFFFENFLIWIYGPVSPHKIMNFFKEWIISGNCVIFYVLGS